MTCQPCSNTSLTAARPFVNYGHWARSIITKASGVPLGTRTGTKCACEPEPYLANAIEDDGHELVRQLLLDEAVILLAGDRTVSLRDYLYG